MSNTFGCCNLCKFNKIAKSALISSAVTSFVIGVPLTVAGSIMIHKTNKNKEGNAGWVVMLVFGILFLIGGISTISAASIYKSAETWIDGNGCLPGQKCCT